MRRSVGVRNWTLVSIRRNKYGRVSHNGRSFERGTSRRFRLIQKVSINTIVRRVSPLAPSSDTTVGLQSRAWRVTRLPRHFMMDITSKIWLS